MSCFERARTKENKEIRLQQIKDATVGLFDTIGYHEITLSKIGKEINFTRGNLYKYISSKEDIFIHIFLDEHLAFVKELEDKLLEIPPLSIEELSGIIAAIAAGRVRYLKLNSILLSIIEQNTELNTLVEFKKLFMCSLTRIKAVLSYHLPDFSEEEILTVFKYMHTAFQTVYYQCNPTPLQLEASKKAGCLFELPTVEQSLMQTITLVITGIRYNKG